MGENGEFAELIEMGEAVEQLGDEPPVFEEEPTPATEAPAEAEAPPQEKVPVKEDPSGGLGEALEEPDDNRLDIDKLLGLPPEGEVPPEQDAPVEAPAPQPEPEAGSMAERMAELTGQMKALREDNERLAARQLQEPTPEPEGVPKPELEGDMKEYLDPYLDSYVEQKVNERISKLEKAVAPMAERTHNDQLTEVINSRVDFDFTSKDMAAVYKEVDGMSEQDQDFYRQGVPAAVLLANELHSRGALGGVKKTTPSTSPLAARHHSETAGFTPASPEDMSEEEKVRRLMAADPASIRAMVDGLE